MSDAKERKRKPIRVDDLLRLRIAGTIKERLERVAERRCETTSTVVRDAIREFLNNHPDEWAEEGN